VVGGKIFDMDTTATQTIILSALSQYGVSVLAILGAVLTLGLAYLVFRFGWKSTKNALDGGYHRSNQTGNISGSGSRVGMHFKDRMEMDAYYRGKALNKRDGIFQD